MKRFFYLGALLIACVVVVLAMACPTLAQNPSPIPASPGETVFGQHCASCHAGPNRTDRAPDLKTLMELTPESVYASITTGTMVVPAQKLTDDEKRLVSEYLGGRPLDKGVAAPAGETQKARERGAPFHQDRREAGDKEPLGHDLGGQPQGLQDVLEPGGHEESPRAD